MADANGNLSQTIVIPVGTAHSSHQVEVRGATSGTVFVDLTIMDGLAAASANSSLAVRGAPDTSVSTAVGAVLLVVGVGAAVTARRRRASSLRR